MKGPSVLAIHIALLITIIVTNVPQSDAITAAQTCAVTKNETYIGDPSSCQAWNYCVNGAVARSGNCRTGQLYSIPNGECDYASNVPCTTNVATMCAGLTNVYKADPTNCQNYCQCLNGTSSCASCPNGMYFEPTTIECVWQDQSTCVQNSPCALSQNGFVRGVNCTNWIRCFNGQQADSGNCPNGLLYNVLTAACDRPANVQCSTSGPPSPTTPATAPTATATTCSGVTTPPTYVTGVTAASNSCRGYFRCTGTTAASAAYGLCPANSSFNPTSRACVDPNQVACPGNRCDGVNKRWMAVPNSGCRQYTPCSNGTPGAVMSCNSRYPFYNEVTQACEDIQPTFPICTATAPAIQ